MKYIKYFEKYEELTDANVEYSEYDRRRGYASGYGNQGKYKYNIKKGDKVIVNGIHDGLVIRNRKGTVLAVYGSNYLIKFDDKFSPRLHDQSGLSKDNNTWYVDPIINPKVEVVPTNKPKIEIEKEKEDDEKNKVTINLVVFQNKSLTLTKTKLRLNPEKSYTIRMGLINFTLNNRDIARTVERKILIMNGRYVGGYSDRVSMVAYTDDADDKKVVTTLGRKLSGYKSRLRNSIKKLEPTLELYKDLIKTFEKIEFKSEENIKQLKSMIMNAPVLKTRDFEDWEENEDEEDDDWFEGSQVHVLIFQPYKIIDGKRKLGDINFKKLTSYVVASDRQGGDHQKLWYDVDIGDTKTLITSDIITKGLIQNIHSNPKYIIYLDEARNDAFQMAKNQLLNFYKNEQTKVKNIKNTIGNIEDAISNNKENLKTLEIYNGRDIYNMDSNKSLTVKFDNPHIQNLGYGGYGY